LFHAERKQLVTSYVRNSVRERGEEPPEVKEKPALSQTTRRGLRCITVGGHRLPSLYRTLSIVGFRQGKKK
jgi:hypothetical protein